MRSRRVGAEQLVQLARPLLDRQHVPVASRDRCRLPRAQSAGSGTGPGSLSSPYAVKLIGTIGCDCGTTMYGMPYGSGAAEIGVQIAAADVRDVGRGVRVDGHRRDVLVPRVVRGKHGQPPIVGNPAGNGVAVGGGVAVGNGITVSFPGIEIAGAAIATPVSPAMLEGPSVVPDSALSMAAVARRFDAAAAVPSRPVLRSSVNAGTEVPAIGAFCASRLAAGAAGLRPAALPLAASIWDRGGSARVAGDALPPHEVTRSSSATLTVIIIRSTCRSNARICLHRECVL